MEFFKVTNIDFMKQRKWAAIFSIIVFTLSIASLFIFKLNLGLDFTGGAQIQVHFPHSVQVSQVRSNLSQAGFKDAVVQLYGTTEDVMIKLQLKNGAPANQLVQQQRQLTSSVLKALPGAKFEGAQMIGPQVGKALVTNGILAVLVCLLSTMAYLAVRFEWRFAVSAAIALVHDPVLILGIFSFFHLEFNLITLAALLTMLGYSLNDTVVVYDRIRENFRKMRKGSPLEIVNVSVNQTLSRTIMTSSLTLVVVLALLAFGGPTLRGFSLALVIGIVIGTYSSIYVASSIALLMGLKKAHLLPAEKKYVDDRP